MAWHEMLRDEKAATFRERSGEAVSRQPSRRDEESVTHTQSAEEEGRKERTNEQCSATSHGRYI